MKKIIILSLILVACSEDEVKIKTVNVGGKQWMTENVGLYHTWQEAMKACPKGFRLPSKDDYQELIDFNSYVVSGKNGFVTGGNTFLKGEWGYYWTSSTISATGSWAYVFDNKDRFLSGDNNSVGMCVRCIKE